MSELAFYHPILRSPSIIGRAPVIKIVISLLRIKLVAALSYATPGHP